MKVFDKLKEALIETDEKLEEFDPSLDEFDYTVEGDFLFDNEKCQSLFFYSHLLSIYYDKIPLDLDLAKACFEEDKEYFFKLISYLRDREGLGRKKEFRIILNSLGEEYPKTFKKYIKLIPKYGRYDDLYEFFYGENEDEVINIFKNQLEKDLSSDTPSTLAKWLKSTNASNKENNILGKRTANLLNMDYKTYRKTLTSLRKKLDVVEVLMSQNRWTEIKYGNLTSRNIKRYQNAFLKHDSERFLEFLKISKLGYRDIEEKSPGFKTKYNYLEMLNKGIEEDNTKEEFNNIINSTYKHLNIPKEDWLPAILLKDENLINRDRYYMQSVFLSNFFLCNNSGLYKDYIIKTKGVPNVKKLNDRNLKNDIIKIIENSISKNISIESVFDLLLLSSLKSGDPNFDFPKGVIFVAHKEEEIKEFSHSNVCSFEEKIAFLYQNLKKKWLDLGFSIPKLKIWIISENYKPAIFEFENRDGYIIKGSGEKAFKYIIKDPKMNLADLTYDEIKNELIKILSSERYNLDIEF